MVLEFTAGRPMKSVRCFWAGMLFLAMASAWGNAGAQVTAADAIPPQFEVAAIKPAMGGSADFGRRI